MAKVLAVGTAQHEDDVQAQQFPLRWRVAKAAPAAVVIQSASASTVAVDPVVEVADYYRDRAASFRKRPKLPRDDNAADERLF